MDLFFYHRSSSTLSIISPALKCSCLFAHHTRVGIKVMSRVVLKIKRTNLSIKYDRIKERSSIDSFYTTMLL